MYQRRHVKCFEIVFGGHFGFIGSFSIRPAVDNNIDGAMIVYFICRYESGSFSFVLLFIGKVIHIVKIVGVIEGQLVQF